MGLQLHQSAMRYRTLLPITWLGAVGTRGGAAVAGHDGMVFRALSDESLLGEDGVIWI